MPPRLAYVFFMLLALVVFLLVRRWQPRAVPVLPWRQRLALNWAALVGAAFGAKVGHVLANGGPWLEAGTWLADGKTVTTGLIGGYLAVELAKLALHVRVKTGDGYALPLALALAVGRWGCFFNRCCFGRPTALPWGVDFGDGIPRHPTQVYESLFHLTAAGVLLALLVADRCRCQRLKLYLIAYGVYRFGSEWLRPEPAWALGLTFYQWASLVLIAGLSVQWWFDRRLPRTVVEAQRAAGKVAPALGAVPQR
jgi:phosphatidylglycerol---prolipoprotein diacylglyceryl transferase